MSFTVNVRSFRVNKLVPRSVHADARRMPAMRMIRRGALLLLALHGPEPIHPEQFSGLHPTQGGNEVAQQYPLLGGLITSLRYL